MLFIYLKLCRKYNYHLITNMLLGNNTFDWVMCSLRVSMISVLQSAMPWCFTNPSSMGTGDQAGGQDSSPQGGQLRHSKGTELYLLALAMKVSSTVLFLMCSLFTSPDPS